MKNFVWMMNFISVVTSYDRFECRLIQLKTIRVGVYLRRDFVEEHLKNGKTVASLKEDMKTILEANPRKLLHAQFNIQFAVDIVTHETALDKELARKLDNIVFSLEKTVEIPDGMENLSSGKHATWYIFHPLERGQGGFLSFKKKTTLGLARGTFGSKSRLAIGWDFSRESTAENGGRRDLYLNELSAITMHELGHILGFDHDSEDTLMNAYFVPPTDVLCSRDRWYWILPVEVAIGFKEIPGFRSHAPAKFSNGDPTTADKQFCEVIRGVDAIGNSVGLAPTPANTEESTCPANLTINIFIYTLIMLCLVGCLVRYIWKTQRKYMRELREKRMKKKAKKKLKKKLEKEKAERERKEKELMAQAARKFQWEQTTPGQTAQTSIRELPAAPDGN